MVPFRIYDKEKKQVWQVINFHPNMDKGSYLASYDGEEHGDDSSRDGEMRFISADEMLNFRFIDFLEEVDNYDE